MRKIAILAWLFVPVLVGAYHFGPGQQHLQLDDAAKYLAQANHAAQAEDWSAAVNSYEATLALLPAENLADSQRVRLQLAKARMMNHQLPVAHTDLVRLVDELNQDESHQATQLRNEARSALANSQFYLTWLMRLEGAAKDAWEPHIDAARQHYKLLAESAEQAGNDAPLTSAQHDLEAAIRLARMDLADLQGLPLPSQ
jgi:hypothetical protein